jgi:hypothetical protein
MPVLNQLPDRQYQGPTDVNKAFGKVARSYLQQASYPRPARPVGRIRPRTGC